MTYTVRIYETEKHARDAVTKLENEGFAEDTILVVTPAGAGKAGDEGGLASAVRAGNALGHRAAFYAERVQQGRSLVMVDAPFGSGQLAVETLESCNPVDLDLAVPAAPEASWGVGAPFSKAVGMPVLLQNSPAPYSQALGLPVLSRGLSFLYSAFGELTKHDYSFSSVFGIPLLSKNPAPLSSLIGLGTKTEKRGEWTHSCGLPLLSTSSKPFSSLMQAPAPLSAALGIPLLRQKQR